MHATRFYMSLVAFATGIALAPVLLPNYPTLLWLLTLSLVAVIVWRRGSGKSGERWLLMSVGLVFFVCGAGRFMLHDATFGRSILENQVGQSISLEGYITREPEERETSLQLYLKTGDDIVLVTTDRYMEVEYGDRLFVVGNLEKPQAFTTDLGRTFDYPQYLKVRSVEYVLPFAQVTVLREGGGNGVVATLLTVKQGFLESLNRALPEPVAGLAAGVLLGVKQALGAPLEQAFRETGIIHIVVLSGYNIMLVVTFVTVVLGSFLSPRVRIVVSLLAIGGFVIMVGPSATVVRACLMATILLLAEITHRRYLALRALLLVATLMLFFNPYLLLYDIGFQLSFMATLGLILLTPYIERVVNFIPERLSLRQFLSATISTQIAVLPLLMFHIGEVSAVGVVVNLLVLPMVPIAMLSAFLLGVIGLIFAPLTPFLAPVVYGSLFYIIMVAESFATLPFAAVLVPEFTLSGLILAYTIYGLGGWYLLAHYPLVERNNEVKKEQIKSRADESLLEDWTIEEESAMVLKKHRTATLKQVAVEETTPIFFR